VRRLIALVALAFLIVGSGSAFATGTPESAAEPTVFVRQDPTFGPFLTDPAGRTLYLFSKDTEPGKSVCTDKCEQNWPVFTATEPLSLPGTVDGELSLITRDDGSTQVAYNGIPLYYFAGDANPGDTNGQAVGDVWWLVAPGADSVAAPASPVAAAPATPAAAGDIMVELSEFAIMTDQTTLKVGETYTLQIMNNGKFTHEAVVEKAGANDEPLEMNGEELEAEDIASGSTATLTVTFTEAGNYQIACHLMSHYPNGMVITLHVVE
jgi:predicted lipoprotein with Yx(FWY)xxD motif/uncharacterized cupredoxin-like copper-binding protein